MHQSESLRGKIGGYRLAATHDSRLTSAPGRAAFMAKFDLAAATGTLPGPERERRAKAAKSAYFAALAYRSAQVRAARRPSSGEGVAVSE